MWTLAMAWLVACPATIDAPNDTGPDDTGGTGVSTDTGVPQASPPALCINEIMEDNRETLTDATGGSPSWVELHNPERGDVSLSGWGLTDDDDEPDRHVFGDTLTVPGLGFVLLYADDQPDLGPEHLAFELNHLGGTLTLTSPEGGTVDASDWIDEWNSDMARARQSDCCQDLLCWSSVRTGTPGTTNVLPEVDDVPLLSAGSTWRYHDQGAELGSSWRGPAYDDGDWASGPGPLGYGDSHQVTEVSYGGDSGDKHAATYFRTTFTADDPAALDSLRLELLYDDGAAVYLNGTEILRAGLPVGMLDADTYATRTASGSGETDYHDFSALSDALLPGTNVLAVEVHQAAPDSSDLGMDLALVGEILVTPR